MAEMDGHLKCDSVPAKHTRQSSSALAWVLTWTSV